MGVLAARPSLIMKPIAVPQPSSMLAMAPGVGARRHQMAPRIGTSMPPTSRL